MATLTQTELNERHEGKVKRYLKETSSPVVKALSDFDFKKRTGMIEQQFNRLAEGHFLKEAMRTSEVFLFYVRQGYCEHYAGTMASLLRLMGIPAHVVVGFQGGTL